MSSIASFYVLPQERLPDLTEAAKSQTEWEFLQDAARELEDAYEWSGYCMLYLLNYLDGKGVPLGEDVLVVITPEHKQYLARLEPAMYDPEEIRRHFAMMALDFEEAGLAGHDGIMLLRDQIAALSPDDVLVITIG